MIFKNIVTDKFESMRNGIVLVGVLLSLNLFCLGNVNTNGGKSSEGINSSDKVNSSDNKVNSSERIIVNGVPWYDQRDSIVSAHGANIIFDNGRYYLFGEFKTDSANVFKGFSCYSSPDLVNWKFERIALGQQSEGRLGPGRVGERPKVLKCPSTEEYIMIMHSDDLRYKDPCTTYATSKTIDGEYEFQGPLLYKGNPIKIWQQRP